MKNEKLSLPERKSLYRKMSIEIDSMVHGLTFEEYLKYSKNIHSEALKLSNEIGLKIYKPHGKSQNKDNRNLLFSILDMISLAEIEAKMFFLTSQDDEERKRNLFKKLKSGSIRCFITSLTFNALKKLKDLGYEEPFLFMVNNAILLDYSEDIEKLISESFGSFKKKNGRIDFSEILETKDAPLI